MFIYYGVVALHVLVCVILILVVLLQSGSKGDLAGAFGGGGSQTAFGSRGPATFLSKMTTAAAVIFMLTSIGLSMISVKREEKSVLETGGRQQTTAPAPVQKAPASQSPSAPVLTPEQIQRRVEELQKKQQAAPANNAAPQQPAPVGSNPAKK